MPLSGDTVGERIIEAYSKAGFSRNAFAKAVGTSTSRVVDWENNKEIKSENLIRISRITNVSIDELLGVTVSHSATATLTEYDESPSDQKHREAFEEFVALGLHKKLSEPQLHALKLARFTDGPSIGKLLDMARLMSGSQTEAPETAAVEKAGDFIKKPLRKKR